MMTLMHSVTSQCGRERYEIGVCRAEFEQLSSAYMAPLPFSYPCSTD